VQQIKNINDLFLEADSHCPDLVLEETVEKVNSVLDTFSVEFTPADRKAGEKLPKIKLSSYDTSVDISRHFSILSTQYQLIGEAKDRGDFGKGNLNMWYKVGDTSGAIATLILADA